MNRSFLLIPGKETRGPRIKEVEISASNVGKETKRGPLVPHPETERVQTRRKCQGVSQKSPTGWRVLVLQENRLQDETRSVPQYERNRKLIGFHKTTC